MQEERLIAARGIACEAAAWAIEAGQLERAVELLEQGVLITAPDGGILNDPVMLRLGANTFWFSLADSDVLLYAKGLAALAGMDVRLSEAEAYPVQLQGPRSKDVVRDLFGEDILGLCRRAGRDPAPRAAPPPPPGITPWDATRQYATMPMP